MEDKLTPEDLSGDDIVKQLMELPTNNFANVEERISENEAQ